MRAPLRVGLLAVVSLTACSDRPPPVGPLSQALNAASDFSIPPVVVPNNSNHGDPNGFAVFWYARYGIDATPTMTVPGATVQCASLQGESGCSMQSHRRYCRCVVSGTAPDTPYTYTIHYGNDPAHPAANATFTATTRTPKPLQPFGTKGVNFSFLFYSDPHGLNPTTMRHVAAAMQSENAAFGLNGGDVGERGNEALDYLTTAYASANQGGLLSTVPFWVTVGNHDWWGNDDYCKLVTSAECDAGWPRLLMLQGGDLTAPRPAYGTFTLPWGSGGLKSSMGWEYRYYSFDWGNSHFVVLDTGLHSRFDVGGWWEGANFFAGMYDLDKDQIDWAIADLAKAHADPKIRHKFVILHTPPYDEAGDVKELIDNPDYDDPPPTPGISLGAHPALEEAMKKFGVRMVLGGHRHHYEHLKANGIHYVTCSGSSNYDINAGSPNTNAQYVSSVYASGGYCLITVNDEDITVQRKEAASAWWNDTEQYPPQPLIRDQFTMGVPTPSGIAIAPVIQDLDTFYTISWRDNSVGEHYYEVLRSTDPSFPAASTKSVGAVSDGCTTGDGCKVGTLSVTDSTTQQFAANTVLYYRVIAWYVATDGTWYKSDPADISTQKTICKVTGLTSTPQAGNQVLLTWKDPGCNIGNPLDHYEVQRKGCAGSWQLGCKPGQWHTINQANASAIASYTDSFPACAKMTYRVRAVYSVFAQSDWSDELLVDGTGIFNCGGNGMWGIGASPSTIKLKWTNDGWQAGLPSAQLEASTDGKAFRTVATGSGDLFTSYDYPVPSSCNTSAQYWFRVGNSDGAGGPVRYGATIVAQPGLCLPSARLATRAGANQVFLAVTFPDPPAGAAKPDGWILARRKAGDTEFGAFRSYAAGVVAIDPDVGCGQAWEYQARGVYSSGTGFYGEGATTDWSPIVSVTASCGPCANGVAADQIFSPGMVGCGGAVTWDQRGSLCAPGYAACTAAEWVKNRGGAAPTDDYWTDDNLTYSGSGSGACQADTTGGSSCGANRPMRVCTATGGDAYGNSCTWTGCGLDGSSNQFFGGCVANATAGTLCCRRTHVCAQTATATQTFAPGVAGCGGSVAWTARNSLCGPGCRACTASEYKAARGATVPAHDYWTDDNLGYTGSGPGACGASLTGASCGTNTPMRVCTPGGTDAEGNACNWTGCGLNGNTPGATNDYFGGCVGNATAGTLCCCDR